MNIWNNTRMYELNIPSISKLPSSIFFAWSMCGIDIGFASNVFYNSKKNVFFYDFLKLSFLSYYLYLRLILLALMLFERL